MSKASVLALASQLANMQGSDTNLDQFYEDAVMDVARQAMFNVLEIIPTHEGQSVYVRPERTVALLGLFYDDTMLSLVTLRELEATTPDWRERLGVPVAYFIEDVSHVAFGVYPTPVAPGDPVIPVHGAPFGLDYPAGTLAVLASDKLHDMPEWMDLPLALIVLAREFSRPSPHMDKVFAGACRNLGTLLLSMVG